MQARTYFLTVARLVRELAGCGAILLALHCPEAEEGHPLLQWLPGDETARLFGATELLVLFEHEQVRAVRDIACQTGQVRFINEPLPAAQGLRVNSVAVAPLLYPCGIAGYFVLANAFAGGFTRGDVRLLDEYLAAILPQFECYMWTLCRMRVGAATFEPAHERRVGTLQDSKAAGSVIDSVKNDLISMVGHELRAPLTAIKGYAALLQAYSLEDRQHENGRSDHGTTITPVRQQSYLDIIMDQAGYLELLMNDLLDVSRIQAGKLVLRYSEVDVAALCRQVMRLALQRIDQTEHDRYVLRCEVPPDLPPLQTDASRLQQILHNLLDNAIKYSPAGGLIELSACMEYETLSTSSFQEAPEIHPVMHITIRDQGIGVNAQQRERLFQPFSRLDHTVTGHVPGTGLGLYITGRLVEALQGSIELTGQEQKGTRVTLRFPLRRPEEALQPLPAGRNTSTDESKNRIRED